MDDPLQNFSFAYRAMTSYDRSIMLSHIERLAIKPEPSGHPRLTHLLYVHSANDSFTIPCRSLGAARQARDTILRHIALQGRS